MHELLEEVRLLRAARRESRVLTTTQDQNDSGTSPPFSDTVPKSDTAGIPSITVVPSPGATTEFPPASVTLETSSQVDLSADEGRSPGRMTTFAVLDISLYSTMNLSFTVVCYVYFYFSVS